MIAALTYWPGAVWGGRKNPPDPVDLTVLPPFFNEVLHDLPWWNRDWKVSHVEPGLPFVAKVGFAGDRLIRFQAKTDDVVLGPAVAPAGRLESHPFARVLTGLMDLRGIPVKRMARETARSMSTIHMLRNGRHNTEGITRSRFSPRRSPRFWACPKQTSESSLDSTTAARGN
ncbi:hypothetical protein ABTX77_41835 [Streptomyces sp. NPDC097704]|uniref:hypothetical protein n=1 Tax=Streptomyces sp. NPDC097704 TaxID=3157101 RepID=UPI00332D39A6